MKARTKKNNTGHAIRRVRPISAKNVRRSAKDIIEPKEWESFLLHLRKTVIRCNAEAN